MITLVTGSQSKLIEWQRLWPLSIKLDSRAVDLNEIQSLDLQEIIRDKAKRAFAIVNNPIIVEDVSAGLNDLGGLPGPFIKFFEKQLGQDALYKLAGKAEKGAIVKCAVAYYDGCNLLSYVAKKTGHVTKPKGHSGFGFDICFVPDGQTKTYAEMTPSEKDSISHRAIAVEQLAALIKKAKIN